MAIIKKNDVTPERPIIIVLYGVPGSGKTSLATTANNPILIDTDRGYDRAVQRVDTLTAQKWTDVTDEYEAIKCYDTVICDTAKSTIDDYLAAYVCEQNYKLKNNALKRFGQMAEEFKHFVSNLRSNNQDLIFICHDKETQEGDIIKHAPDCTGQSKDLLIRIADQVGYVSIINKQRVVTFEPMDNYVGKNVAQLGAIPIPEAKTPEFSNFMDNIIKSVKRAIQSKSEEQRLAGEKLAKLRELLVQTETAEQAKELLKEATQLPPIHKAPFFNEIKSELSKKGFTYDPKAKEFVINNNED